MKKEKQINQTQLTKQMIIEALKNSNFRITNLSSQSSKIKAKHICKQTNI
jgi:hypothetical protein